MSNQHLTVYFQLKADSKKRRAWVQCFVSIYLLVHMLESSPA